MNNSQKPLIHLICGPIGAGKSTFSRELADISGGVVFSIDEWMVSLFGEDAPKIADPNWIFPRVERCEKQMWAMAQRLGALRVPSILDFGFQRYEHRQRYKNLANEARLAAKMHVLDVDASERWKRVEARNTSKGKTFQLKISRGMFDYIETIWEQPNEDEIAFVSRTGFGSHTAMAIKRPFIRLAVFVSQGSFQTSNATQQVGTESYICGCERPESAVRPLTEMPQR